MLSLERPAVIPITLRLVHICPIPAESGGRRRRSGLTATNRAKRKRLLRPRPKDPRPTEPFFSGRFAGRGRCGRSIRKIGKLATNLRKVGSGGLNESLEAEQGNTGILAAAGGERGQRGIPYREEVVEVTG